MPLEDVPDPVFSQKIIGDGVAVFPSEGRIVKSGGWTGSICGRYRSCIWPENRRDGLEILIHVGLETVSLKGECFNVYVKPGDQVKAGDKLAEVDLGFLAEKNISPVTPVLICGGNGRKETDKESGGDGAGRKKCSFNSGRRG